VQLHPVTTSLHDTTQQTHMQTITCINTNVPTVLYSEGKKLCWRI